MTETLSPRETFQPRDKLDWKEVEWYYLISPNILCSQLTHLIRVIGGNKNLHTLQPPRTKIASLVLEYLRFLMVSLLITTLHLNNPVSICP